VFAKHRKQIWNSSDIVQFFPNGPTVKTLFGQVDILCMKDPPARHFILTVTDSDISKYQYGVINGHKKLLIQSTQTVDGVNMTVGVLE
jgi:hypothetical protein